MRKATLIRALMALASIGTALASAELIGPK
jgi:hypothetical protein